MSSRSVFLIVLVTLLSASWVPDAALAQAEVRTAKPEELGKRVITEVPSPMLVEVPLARMQIDGAAAGAKWFDRSMDLYWCDKARVERVDVVKGKAKKGRQLIVVAPVLATDYYRQDIDLTISLVAPDGSIIAKRFWDNLTIGNDKYSGLWGSSRTKQPELEAWVDVADIPRLFGEGSKPIVRIVVDIQGDEEDED